jgi:hypothetical protein
MPVDPDDALRVWRVKQPPLADETSKYPLAVRFHEVGESKEYYIGFQCGEQHWCVIGVDDAAKPPKGLQPVTSGFVDEQRLGIYDADDRELKPTDLRGLLVARQDIASLDTAAFVDKIVRVADLYIQGDDDEAREFYAVKYGLDDVSETHGPIVVSLSYRRGGFKFYYNGKATDRPTEIKPKDSDHPLPGGARWRWSTNDEGVWIFCPAGCCGDDGCVPPYCDRR